MTPPLIVGGLGRCGSSLVMQMLDAGGYPVTGEWPAFETDQADPHSDTYDAAWVAAQHGKAVKILDLHRAEAVIPDDSPVIWPWRNLREQSRSQAKLLTTMGVDVKPHEVSGIARLLRNDQRRARSVLLRRRHLPLKFSEILADTHRVASQIAEFVGIDLDIGAMAGAVIPRGPQCYAGLLELDLLKNGRP